MSEYEVVVQFETKEDQERYFKNISINIKGILSVSKINLLHIEELEHKLALAKKALEEIHVAEMMGLLINGKKVATRTLEQLK